MRINKAKNWSIDWKMHYGKVQYIKLAYKLDQLKNVLLLLFPTV